MPTYAYWNNGTSRRAVEAAYVAQPGEVVFPDIATPDELTAAFSGYVVAAAAANAPAQYAAALMAGIQITSTATPSLNGTYPVDDTTQGKITGIAAGINSNKGLPGGGSTFNYPDITGTMHAFGAADFLNFAAAVETYVYGLVQTEVALIGQHTATWPSASVTIP